jgi:hypothetical protein
MVLGALIAAGATPEWLCSLPERLGLAGVTVTMEEVDRGGVRATKITVRTAEGTVEGEGRVDAAHPHRQVGELLAIVDRANVSPWVKAHATAAFRLLGEAEGRVHGVPAERVSLHEVGAVDALVDIVGAIEGFEQLGVTDVYARPLALGSGWVQAAHGALPIPAPATTLLVEGLPIGPDGPVVGEATTPTGAVLLRVLSRGLPPSHWRAVRSGWGAGTRNPGGYPNALRLTLAEPVAEAAEVIVVSADLDDLNPEYLEPLRVALVDAGALDVQMWSSYMKKGRIGFRVEAIAPVGLDQAVAEAFFAHSTTAGVRWHRATRETLTRRQVSVETAGGDAVRVKVLEGPAGPTVKPEYEDVIAAARRSGRPAQEIAAEAQETARARVRRPASATPLGHKESS